MPERFSFPKYKAGLLCAVLPFVSRKPVNSSNTFPDDVKNKESGNSSPPVVGFR